MWVETKLLAPDAATGDRFGLTVNIENNRLLIGARSGEIMGSNTGTAYIYDYNLVSNVWGFTQEIAADDITTSNFFASALDLSGDTIIVGNFNDSDNGSQSGAAYVFDLVGGTWQQSQKVVTQGAVDDNFGYSISLDGNRALIGAPFDADNGLNSGAAYIFDYINGQWSTPTKLFASDSSLNFGSAVNLDNNNAIIAANKINQLSQGKVYIYNFDGITWNEVALFESPTTSSDDYGSSVSIFADRAIVGVSQEIEAGVKSGTVYIYENIANIWQSAGKLIPSDGQVFDSFGISVSLSEERALVGAYTKDDVINSLNGTGAAYIYDHDSVNDLWIETKLQIPNPFNNGFAGSSVDLDGNRAIVGARNSHGQKGSVSIFDYDVNTDMWNGITLIASDGGSLDNFGISVSLDGDRALIGAYLDDDNGSNAGAAYQFNFDGNTWLETKKHLASDGARNDYYGFSVALSGDNALIGAYQDDAVGTDSGSVYTFNIEFVFGNGFE
jgi:hypothetical protein